METPKSIANATGGEFPEGQAYAIAAEVYQPLLDEIKRLEKRVDALEGRQIESPMSISGLRRHSACGTKGCPYCDR